MTWLQNAFGTMLGWFESWSGSYAIALLFYALIFKIVFLPFSIKQQKNQIANAKLTPKIELIRAKYRGRTDRVTMQKQQQEIMELQQKEGYSPFSGCLPMIIQLFLLIPLYNVIRSPLTFIAKFKDESVLKIYNFLNPDKVAEKFSEVQQIGLVSQIRDYVAKNGAYDLTTLTELKNGKEILTSEAFEALLPNFQLFGIDFALNPTLIPFTILVLVPVVVALTQWFSMWIIKKFNSNPMMAVQQNDAQTQMSMKIMDLVLPAMTLFMAFSVPAMLGVYWIYQSILSVIQSFILAKAMPLPKFTEEEIKAMRKAQKAQEKAQKEALKAQPKYKSLHYIDEDDYDELPDVKANTKPQGTSLSNGDIPEIKD